MKRTITVVAVLLVGLAIGAGLMWMYAKSAKNGVKTHTASAGKERKILYYRNPMNPSVTSPTPLKDNMGMDYVPVYEGAAGKEAMPPGAVSISPEKIQKIGVKSVEVKRRTLSRTIRTVGRVDPVEDKVYIINAKVSGWVEKLHVSRTDQMVRAGDRLLEIYSPDLVSAQEEYLLALKGLKDVQDSPYPEVKRMAGELVAAGAQRLKYWDISDDQIQRLKSSGKISRTMTIQAPDNGSVTEKMVVEGQKIEAGEPLFKIIDHSVVWVYGEVYEYEIPYIKGGESAKLYPSYTPAEVYHGRVEHIYSHLGSIRYVPEGGTEIRTAKIRFELPNSGHRLKLGMYLNIELDVNAAKNALVVPDSAVIDTGTRQLVIVDRGEGLFEPREVRIGAKADGLYEVLKGVKEGERVVTSANFLVDSESNLTAAIGAPKAVNKEEEIDQTTPAGKQIPAEAGHSGHGK